MEYVITSQLPFAEIEARTIEALERQGLVVQRTFSLRSAVEAGGDLTEKRLPTDAKPGYTILMLYASGLQGQPLGLLTLYERGGSTVLSPMVTPHSEEEIAIPVAGGPVADADADLVAALLRSGLEFCLDIAASEDCIDLRAAAEESAQSGRLVRDPVCGKWIEVAQAEAGIEYKGKVHYVCCPLCREGFERNPGRYA